MSEVKIFHGDALKVIKSLPDKSIDAVITDPPYCSGGNTEAEKRQAKGQGLRSSSLKKNGWFLGDNMGTNGLLFLLRSVAFESIRLFKNKGHLLVFCDWRMVPAIAPALESAGYRYQNMIVWDKITPGLGRGFRSQHELILHMTIGTPDYYDRQTGNVIKSKRVLQNKVHQTEKPQNLIEHLISVVCPEGGTVLDPFAGSGTTAAAAKSINRNSIIIERCKNNIDIAMQRLENGEQTSLFC